MIIKTRYGIDCWDDPNTGETVYMPHIPPVNNCTVTVAYQRDNGEFYPFDYDDETLDHALSESVLASATFGAYLTIDTDNGILTFFNRLGEEEQQITILPYTLDLIKKNLEADPTALDRWNQKVKVSHLPLEFALSLQRAAIERESHASKNGTQSEI